MSGAAGSALPPPENPGSARLCWDVGHRPVSAEVQLDDRAVRVCGRGTVTLYGDAVGTLLQKRRSAEAGGVLLGERAIVTNRGAAPPPGDRPAAAGSGAPIEVGIAFFLSRPGGGETFADSGDGEAFLGADARNAVTAVIIVPAASDEHERCRDQQRSDLYT